MGKVIWAILMKNKELQSQGKKEHRTYNKKKRGANRIGHILIRNVSPKNVI